MAVYTNLNVYQAAYGLILDLYRSMPRLPREVTYTLLQELRSDALSVIRHIYRANALRDRVEELDRSLDDILNVKVRLRILHDLHHLSLKTYARYAQQAEEVSKQLTAWRSYSARRMEDKDRGGEPLSGEKGKH